ncbi:MAG: hypothetical protein L6Q97_13070, partial [Thermoanaerobaculia bacterium]|nr:hypothetical protein [Thermoanaerobaculia bacterium]
FPHPFDTLKMQVLLKYQCLIRSIAGKKQVFARFPSFRRNKRPQIIQFQIPVYLHPEDHRRQTSFFVKKQGIYRGLENRIGFDHGGFIQWFVLV